MTTSMQKQTARSDDEADQKVGSAGDEAVEKMVQLTAAAASILELDRREQVEQTQRSDHPQQSAQLQQVDQQQADRTDQLHQPDQPRQPDNSQQSVSSAEVVSPAEATESAKASEPPYPWILNPVADILMCCGGLVAIFGLLVYLAPQVFSIKNPIMQGLVIFSLITLSMPHGVTSYLRVYNSKHSSNSLKIKITVLGIICALAGYSSLLSEQCWSFFAHVTYYLGLQHLFSQSYGVALIYCYKRQYFFKKWEQKVFWFAVQMGGINGACWVFSHDNWKLNARSMGPAIFPAWTSDASLYLMYAAILAFLGICARKYVLEHKWFPVPAFLCMLASFVVVGSLPFLLNKYLMVALIIAPGFHLTQYLAVTASYHVKECGLRPNVPYSKISREMFSPRALNYFLFLLGAGWITTTCIIPAVYSFFRSLGFDPTMVVVAVFLTINAHHYITDSIIWKQKDPYIRKLLVA